MEYGPYSTDEKDAVNNFVLPDPLKTAEGRRITTAAEWCNFQRSAILEKLKKYEYGEILPRPDALEFELLSRKENALEGRAVRKEIRIICSMRNGKSFSFIMLLYIPKNAKHPVPAFAGLNFKGNHNTTKENDVLKTGCRNPGELAEVRREVQYNRWVPETIVERGYATATCCYHDIFPDRAGAEGESIFQLFFTPEQCGAIHEKYSVIGAWAWGLSRMLDYLESDPDIDGTCVAVHGHSRLGKTALWAGAVDPRFAMVISNDSGCGGGALHRRKYGENISQHFEAHLRQGVPCWFVNELERYLWREEELPVDQHELLAMAAPRPLAVATATKDLYADPKGEFLACKAASEVYRLFGSKGLEAENMPAPDINISGEISFHYRTGVHEQTPQDWAHYLDLADRYLRGNRE